MTDGSRRSVAYDPTGSSRWSGSGQVTSTSPKVTRWYAHNTVDVKVVCTHIWLQVRVVWGLELRELPLEPEGASSALLRATLKGRERMQLRVLYARNVGSRPSCLCGATGVTRLAGALPPPARRWHHSLRRDGPCHMGLRRRRRWQLAPGSSSLRAPLAV